MGYNPDNYTPEEIAAIKSYINRYGSLPKPGELVQHQPYRGAIFEEGFFSDVMAGVGQRSESLLKSVTSPRAAVAITAAAVAVTAYVFRKPISKVFR